VLLDFWNEHIVPTFDNIWNIIKTIVETAINVVLGIIKTVMAIITGDWELAWETVKQVAYDLWEGIKAVVTEFIEGVANAVGTTTDEIIETWRNNWEMAKTIAETIWKNIVKGITDNINEVKRVIIDGILSVRRWLWDQVNQWYTIGHTLMTSLWEGMKAIMEQILSWIAVQAQRMIRKAQEVFKIGSPSRVFEDMGQNLMEGLTIGMARMAPIVQAQMQAVVQAPAIALGRRIGDVTNISTNNYNLTTQSTMRPGGLAMEFGAMKFAGAGMSR
jgi:phage-related protein